MYYLYDVSSGEILFVDQSLKIVISALRLINKHNRLHRFDIPFDNYEILTVADLDSLPPEDQP